MPEQDTQKVAEPQSGLSDAEKAERRKAKKARQRAARAEAAALATKVRPLTSSSQTLFAKLIKKPVI